MLVKLKSGFFQDGEAVSASGASQLKRRALLVYVGEFESMNGPVSVTAEHLSRVAANHNTLLSKFARLAAGAVGTVALKHCPPIQLDHSASARDTVGRLVGNIETGDHTLEDGTLVPAIFGDVLILGKDNVERVEDGRWTNLSLGVDFDVGKIAELTITPFPAAGDASFLSKKPPAPTQLSEPEEDMDKTKLAAYLTGHKGMSEAEATAHLAVLTDEGVASLAAEVDAHETKLAADAVAAAEKEKADADEKAKTELTARRASLTQLSTSFVASRTAARLKAREGRILTRLSKLRAQAKITPAEIKKMDLAKLAASEDAAIELALATYEAREPVVMVGQLGSIKSVSLGTLHQDAKLAKLEAETRANMSLLRRKDAKTKMASSDGNPPPPEAREDPRADDQGGTQDPADTSPEDAAFFEREYGEICSLMDGARADEAKMRIKAFMHKLMALGAAQSGEYTEANAMETEQRLSAVASEVDKMSADFESLHKLATSIAGAAS
jgi:hypothetical protein